MFFPISLPIDSIQVSKLGFQFCVAYFIKTEYICVFIVTIIPTHILRVQFIDLVLKEKKIAINFIILQIPLCLGI
jgi:hypothetical protein